MLVMTMTIRRRLSDDTLLTTTLGRAGARFWARSRGTARRLMSLMYVVSMRVCAETRSRMDPLELHGVCAFVFVPRGLVDRVELGVFRVVALLLGRMDVGMRAAVVVLGILVIRARRMCMMFMPVRMLVSGMGVMIVMIMAVMMLVLLTVLMVMVIMAPGNRLSPDVFRKGTLLEISSLIVMMMFVNVLMIMIMAMLM